MQIDDSDFADLQNNVRNAKYLFSVIAERIWDKVDENRDRCTDSLLEIALAQIGDISRYLQDLERKENCTEKPVDLAA